MKIVAIRQATHTQPQVDAHVSGIFVTLPSLREEYQEQNW